jgi:quercetin dioxygenase-like cupin family protein
LPRHAVIALEDVPQVQSESDEPVWYPLQHVFALTAFGVNVYVAKTDGQGIIGDHDESGSDQEELYLVTAGEAEFTIDGESHAASAGTVVAIPDPTVRRAAVAKTGGTTVIAIGGQRRESFRTSWQLHHFENVPRL